jgi:hypothetical protein
VKNSFHFLFVFILYFPRHIAHGMERGYYEDGSGRVEVHNKLDKNRRGEGYQKKAKNIKIFAWREQENFQGKRGFKSAV